MSSVYENEMALELFRDLAKGPSPNRSSGGLDLGATMKQVQDSAKEERRKKYCCVRGSSALNSRSGTDAFKMSIVRQAQLLPVCCIPHTIAMCIPKEQPTSNPGLAFRPALLVIAIGGCCCA